MKSNFKKLGNYITEINIRNVGLQEITLLGVSIQKIFIPSIANIIGTDMSTYKIVRRGQFAYGPITSRNGDKISIALLSDYDEAIVSQAYTCFEIIDKNCLLPEYLMMWFSRPEFDRYARFMSHGSAREAFGWEEMCNVELPVPPIEKQKEIVAEYHTIVNRIKLNEELNRKLEETAQTIYKQWFVDFEFPDENGNPYKSCGGEMVWDEELQKNIPQNWQNKRMDQIAKISAGGDKPRSFSPIKTAEYTVPILSNTTIDEGLYGYTAEAKVTEKSITISARGAIIGYTVLRLEPFFPIVRLIVVTPYAENILNYLFECIKEFRYNDAASAQGQLTVPEFSTYNVIVPQDQILSKFQGILTSLTNCIEVHKYQLKMLSKLEELLFTKMTKVA